MTRIAVAGATGRVGRHVVDVLHEGGHDVVAISRANGVDVITGEGLAAALEGVEVVIDTSTGPSAGAGAGHGVLPHGDQEPGGGRRQGGRAQAGAGVDHRRRQEHRRLRRGQARAGAGRAGRADPGADPARGPVRRVRRGADGLGAAGRRGLPAQDAHPDRRGPDRGGGARRHGPVPDEPEGAQPAEIAGPREEYLPDLAQLVAAKRGEQVKIEAVSNPADPDDALNSNGGLLPGPHATLAGPTFAEWLEAT